MRSRRLGISLGVNLLPPTAKICNFDCIYCECGWNSDHRGGSFNAKEEVLEILSETLVDMHAKGEPADYITFAGNGEPTMHPDFEEIIDRTLALRDKIAPEAKVAVLTNGTMIHREAVRRALSRVDKAMVKFDSAIDATYQVMNQPLSRRTVSEIVDLLKLFKGDFIMQSMFLKGEYRGASFDNTTEQEVTAWLEVVRATSPREVMLYSIDRDTPHDRLTKVTREELLSIASRVESLSIPTTVS